MEDFYRVVRSLLDFNLAAKYKMCFKSAKIWPKNAKNCTKMSYRPDLWRVKHKNSSKTLDFNFWKQIPDFTAMLIPWPGNKKTSIFCSGHDAFAETRQRVYVRDATSFQILDGVVGCCGATSRNSALLISGENGSGQSSLIANWVAHQKRHDAARKIQRWLLLFFKKISFRSHNYGNLFGVVLKICLEIKTKLSTLKKQAAFQWQSFGSHLLSSFYVCVPSKRMRVV